MSAAVVSGVAEVKGVDPADLDERLYDYVDPGALDRLFRADGDGPEIRATFAIAGCRVEIYGPRKVVVTTRISPAAVREEAL